MPGGTFSSGGWRDARQIAMVIDRDTSCTRHGVVLYIRVERESNLKSWKYPEVLLVWRITT
jgi:hypothetical protein